MSAELENKISRIKHKLLSDGFLSLMGEKFLDISNAFVMYYEDKKSYLITDILRIRPHITNNDKYICLSKSTGKKSESIIFRLNHFFYLFVEKNMTFNEIFFSCPKDTKDLLENKTQ